MGWNWEAVGSIGTILVVIFGAVWNDGRFKQWVKDLATKTDVHEKDLKAHSDTLSMHHSAISVHTTRLDAHEARITAAEQWNVGFQSAAMVGNKGPLRRPRKNPEE